MGTVVAWPGMVDGQMSGKSDWWARPDMGRPIFLDEPVAQEHIDRIRANCPSIKWDSETVLPSGAIVRRAKGIESVSLPFHEDGWNPCN